MKEFLKAIIKNLKEPITINEEILREKTIWGGVGDFEEFKLIVLTKNGIKEILGERKYGQFEKKPGGDLKQIVNKSYNLDESVDLLLTDIGSLKRIFAEKPITIELSSSIKEQVRKETSISELRTIKEITNQILVLDSLLDKEIDEVNKQLDCFSKTKRYSNNDVNCAEHLYYYSKITNRRTQLWDEYNRIIEEKERYVLDILEGKKK